MVDEVHEDDGVDEEDAEAREQEMQMYWSFIVGMLTNLGALPLPRCVDSFDCMTARFSLLCCAASTPCSRCLPKATSL